MPKNFFDPTLLDTEYAKQLRTTYEDTRGTPFLNYYRSYPRFVSALSAIHEYKKEHARSYAKRVNQEHDLKNCEAIFTEIIVYSSYPPSSRRSISTLCPSSIRNGRKRSSSKRCVSPCVKPSNST